MRILSLQSGTSADGIDAAIVQFTAAGDDPRRPELTLRQIAAETVDWAPELRRDLLAFADGAALDAGALTRLTTAAGRAFAAAAADLCARFGPVDLVVSHGQTVYHWVEDGHARGTLQLGEAAWIAEAVGAPVLSNLRAADIAAGGEGAPLMGIFDRAWFGDNVPAASLNLGGIANLQIVLASGEILAFDTGPANVLIDAAIARSSGGSLGYDPDGSHAAAGTVHDGVLSALLAHPYLARPAPKSTGRETFTLDVVDAALAASGARDLGLRDLLATLTRYSAVSVAGALQTAAPDLGLVIASGGGVDNPTLLAELRAALPAGVELATSAEHGIDPGFKESLLFALIGYLSWHGLPLSLRAENPRIAGVFSAGIAPLRLPEPLLGIAGLHIFSPDRNSHESEHRND